MGLACRVLGGITALMLAHTISAQVIEFESNGLTYQTLTRNSLTIMVAWLPAQVRDFSVIQVAVSNGGTAPQTIRPEDFLFIRDDGGEIPASPARTVVDQLMDRASRGDVVKLITSYENGIYGNTRYRATNGYEQRRQSALTEFTSTRVRAAAAASAIAFVQTKLMPGQSTDGAVFYPIYGKPLGNGVIRVRAANSAFEFPLVSSRLNHPNPDLQ
jgi:hypothetical protein